MTGKRVVVVTGGASGIALAITRLFVANGHPVAVFDKQKELADREAAALRNTGAKILPCVVDVSNRGQVDAAYSTVRKELGPITA